MEDEERVVAAMAVLVAQVTAVATAAQQAHLILVMAAAVVQGVMQAAAVTAVLVQHPIPAMGPTEQQAQAAQAAAAVVVLEATVAPTATAVRVVVSDCLVKDAMVEREREASEPRATRGPGLLAAAVRAALGAAT